MSGSSGPNARVAPVVSGRLRPNRRTFLGWVGRYAAGAGAAAAAGEIARYFAFEPHADVASAIQVGKPGDYPSGALTYVAAARAYIGRDDQGLYALDAVCTHLGCLVAQRAEGGFACPCHDSQFGADGELRSGPANASLPHLGLEVTQDGQVVVQRAQHVAPAFRLALPA